MQSLRPALAALTVTLVSLPTLVLGCAPAGGEPRAADGDRRPVKAATREPASRPSTTAERSTRALPREDARGADVGGLPRFPGSVRVGYTMGAADGLKVVRVRYVAAHDPGALHGFYRDVFRSAKAWRVANLEYAGGTWRFLVVRGGSEAEVRISPHKLGAEAEVRLSEPHRDVGQDQGRASSASGGSKR